MNAIHETEAMRDMEQAAHANDLARTVFFPVFPVIAHQILEEADIDSGLCLDIGSGTGHLAIAIATLSNLTVYAMDNSEPMRRIAQATIRRYRLGQRVKTTPGDVNAIPFGAASMNLVVSRGSFFFWPSLSRGFSECLRVLKPGGVAYIGDGFGNARLESEVRAQMIERNPAWNSNQRELYLRCNPYTILSALAAAGIIDYRIIDDESGFWIAFRKM